KEQETARSVAVSSVERMTGFLEEIAKPLQPLKENEFKELSDLMTFYKDQPRFEDVGDFERGFYDLYMKNPSVEQIEGYFAASRVHDLDLIIRDLDVYKQKATLGVEKIKT